MWTIDTSNVQLMCGRQLTVRQLHWLIQWLVVSWLEASRPQQHKLVALLDEGVRRRVDRALAAAKHKVCCCHMQCLNSLYCASMMGQQVDAAASVLDADQSTPEVVDEAEGDAIRQLECDAAKCAAHELREAIQVHLHM